MRSKKFRLTASPDARARVADRILSRLTEQAHIIKQDGDRVIIQIDTDQDTVADWCVWNDGDDREPEDLEIDPDPEEQYGI